MVVGGSHLGSVKRRGKQFVWVLSVCPCEKMPVVTHYRPSQTAERGCRRTSKRRQRAADVSRLSLSLSASLVLSSCFRNFTKMRAFFREWATSRCNVAHADKWAPMMCACKREPRTHTMCRNTRLRTGCLVDHRHRTLHSKCTFSWQTCSVFHFKCPSSSSSSSLHFVLHKAIALKLCLLAFVYLLFGLFL